MFVCVCVCVCVCVPIYTQTHTLSLYLFLSYTHTHEVQEEFEQYLCNFSTTWIFFIFWTINMKKTSYIFFFRTRLSICNTNDIILKYMLYCYSFILLYLLSCESQNLNTQACRKHRSLIDIYSDI